MYTKEIVADMVVRYKECTTDEERALLVSKLANEVGESEQSVRAKLVYEKVYIAKKRCTKDGGPVISKAKLVDQIIEEMGLELTESEACSLEKATKTTLKKVLSEVNSMRHKIVQLHDLCQFGP